MTVKGFVHIVESPSADDLLENRLEGDPVRKALDLAQIPNTYCLSINRQAFKEAVTQRLASAWAKYQVNPVLHLSMHGNQEGIALTDGTFLSWADLREELKPLLRGMQGRLLICMSACFGVAGCRMAMHQEQDEPFWALVGSRSAATWPEAAVGYISFYHLFFRGLDVEECVRRMNLASGRDDFMVMNGHRLKREWTVLVDQQRFQDSIPRGGLLGQGIIDSVRTGTEN